jgi:hypothetical protein
VSLTRRSAQQVLRPDQNSRISLEQNVFHRTLGLSKAVCLGKFRLTNSLKSPSRLHAEESLEIIPTQTKSGVENRIGVAMKLLHLLASLLVPLVLVGCRTISGKLPPAAPPVATVDFQAGVACVDITPMPGYPMGGHSLRNRMGRQNCLTR